MISAGERAWNSATTLYLARRLQALRGEPGRTQPLAVLDVGCGDGTVMEQLLDYGHSLYGYELRASGQDPRGRLGARLGAEYDHRVRWASDERSIPFGDASFDVLYANQVCEHVRFLDRLLGECARVLKPGGVLLATFPLATAPVEWHLKVPFAHWVPPGGLRVRYLQAFYGLGLRPRLAGASALETARAQDAYLTERVFYRFLNEVVMLAGHHFGSCQTETALWLRAKLDLLGARGGAAGAGVTLLRPLAGATLAAAVTHLFNAAFCLRAPSAPRAPGAGDAPSAGAVPHGR